MLGEGAEEASSIGRKRRVAKRVLKCRGGVTSLLLSKDEATLYTGDVSGEAVAWDVASGTRKQTLACDGEVLCLALSKDEATLFTGDDSKKVVAWDVASVDRKSVV